MSNNFKEKIVHTFSRLKTDKKSLLIIFLGIIGMLLIFLSELTDKTTATVSDVSSEYECNIGNHKQELEEILSEISGAGRVKAMITYEGSSENIFASDSTQMKDDGSNKITSEYIIIDKGSEEEGLLLKKVFPKVLGVAVVCDGGDDIKVVNEMTTVIKAIFNISSNNISISKMQNVRK